MEYVGQQHALEVEADNKQASMEDRSKSTDPLTLDIKQVATEAQPNRSERSKHTGDGKHSRKGSDAPVSEKEDLPAPDMQRQRSFSQTHDGVFANLTAKPEVMVLPKDEPYNDDPPPVQSIAGSRVLMRFRHTWTRGLMGRFDT